MQMTQRDKQIVSITGQVVGQQWPNLSLRPVCTQPSGHRCGVVSLLALCVEVVLDNGRGSEEGSQSGGLGGMTWAALLWMSVEEETQSPD